MTSYDVDYFLVQAIYLSHEKPNGYKDYFHKMVDMLETKDLDQEQKTILDSIKNKKWED